MFLNEFLPSSDIPTEVQFYVDPELQDTPYDAVYAAYEDGRSWTLNPRPENVSTVQDIIDAEEEYDDEYY